MITRVVCKGVDGSVSSCHQIYDPTDICIPVGNALEIPLSCDNLNLKGNLTWFLLSLVHLTPGIWHDCNNFCKLALCNLDWTGPHIWNWHAFIRVRGPVAAWNLHDLMPTSLRVLSRKITKFIAHPLIPEIVKFYLWRLSKDNILNIHIDGHL